MNLYQDLEKESLKEPGMKFILAYSLTKLNKALKNLEESNLPPEQKKVIESLS